MLGTRPYYPSVGYSISTFFVPMYWSMPLLKLTDIKKESQYRLEGSNYHQTQLKGKIVMCYSQFEVKIRPSAGMTLIDIFRF